MNCKIPFTKDIDFEKKVSEITSISLEHEISVEDNTLKGNFVVSGDFKSHEVSINKEPFSYILPFEIDLTEDIDKETIDFLIDDFTYEILDNTILRIKIEFNVIASKKETQEEVVEEPLFQDASKAFSDERKDEEVETTEERPVVIEAEKEEVISKESEDMIINSTKGMDDEYTTYHIHMVTDGETVETICTMYNSSIGILGEYNDLTSITPGDKIVIPEKNE